MRAGKSTSAHKAITDIRQFNLWTRMSKWILLAIALTAPAAAVMAIPANHTPRDLQWVFRETLGDGSQGPTAIFLSWNYDAVIFTATCDQKTTELVVRYYAPTSVTNADSALWIGTVRLQTVRDGEYLEGRSRLTSSLKSIMGSPMEIEIGAPNEMGEAFHVGQAEPLRRIALECQ